MPPKDPSYSPVPYIYKSIGLTARPISDQAPQYSYLNMMNCLEREELAVSSRYGTLIINRNPTSAFGGSNHPFPEPITTIARLTYGNLAYRYGGDSSGTLWRRTGNVQGPYTSIFTGLSGQPFGSVVTNCFENSQPYLFIYDLDQSIKDVGTGTPTLTGLDPSPYTINSLPYSPLLSLIDNFASTNTYTTSGFSAAWTYGAITTLTATGGEVITDFPQFTGIQQSGSSMYTVAGSTVSATAAAPNSATDSAIYSGFTSVAVPPGEVASISVPVNAAFGGRLPPNNIAGSSLTLQYSADAGATWTTFLSISGVPSFVGTVNQTIPGVANISTIQVQAIVAITSSVGTNTVTATIGTISVVIVTPNVFGEVTNGMLSLLATTAPIAIPIISVASITLTGGLYVQLLVTTQSAHGLSGGENISIYASSNDLADGFYQVITAPTTTTFVVSFPTAVAISATGGIAYYGGNPPATCALVNQYSTPYPSQMSAWGFYSQVPKTQASFPVSAWSGTVAQNTTGTVGNTIALDLSQANQVTDDDLIVLTLAVGDPASISNIRLQFDIAGSGYTSSYYYKDLAPAYYQESVQQLEDAYTATEQQIFADTLGLLTGQPPNSTTSQLQPGNISTGQGSWVAIYLRRGDFIPVGSAGQSGFDWTSVTGWQLVITTNTVGSTEISANGIYLQWGYGPSSFGGVGYDYRVTPYSLTTGDEGNGTPTQRFDPQFGYLASLAAPIYLRQAVQVTGQYYTDTQVTHLRIYRRGGTYSQNWFQIDQVPNLPTGGQFQYKDVIPDAVLAQANPLQLDNDPPVTSSLRLPIATTLSAPTIAPGNSIFSTFSPQLITVAQSSATFVVDQVVVVGYPTSLEEVRVIIGGSGQFTAIVRLQHNAGEPVNVYSVPRQHCNLAAEAYGQVWLAGDTNNPNYLYFSKRGRPESFSPAAYIPVGSPKYTITAVWNWRGNLFVRTTATWWLIVGGAQPYAQPTGSMHGGPAIKGTAQSEQGIWYQSADGLRRFSGSEGQYMSLPIEFIYRQTQSQTPLPVADPNHYADTVMAFYNNDVFISYIATNGNRYRLVFNENYSRFRIDDIAATAMLWEEDTNILLVAREINGSYYICQDQVYGQDYDDGGIGSGGALVQIPIALTIQSPFTDLGQPHFPKQWNVLETDINPQGQQLTTTLTFNTEPPTTLALPNYTGGTVRAKKQFQITPTTPAGPVASGMQAYSMSMTHTMSVTVAPIFYQENIYATVLADYRTSFDTYWLKFSTDKSKIVRQAYFDYTSTQTITVNLYADGSMIPYYTFTLPDEPDRLSVRRLFIAWKPRLWRMIAVSTGDFQFWSAPMVEFKIIQEGSTFSQYDLGSQQP